jgi:hypothetical protein
VLFHVAAAISLLVACAATVLWVVSYRRADSAYWFVQLPDPTEDDWQGLLGVYRIYAVQSSYGAVGFWVRNREVWLSTPFPNPGFKHSSALPLVPPNCAMNNAFAGGDAHCFPNEYDFALRWDVSRKTNDWPYQSPWVARMIVLPWWVIVTGFCLLPTLWAYGMFRRLRKRFMDPNLCRECGYDLRATPERCPECGTPRVLPAPPLS